MTNQAHKEIETILPEDSRQAVNSLIKITKQLCGIADRESLALAHDDVTTFSILQNEKEKIANRYVSASNEFHARMNEFRGMDVTLLNQLEKLQNDLGEKSKDNNNVVEKMYDRSKGRAQSSLLAAQEISQNCHVRFEDRVEGAANDDTAGA